MTKILRFRYMNFNYMQDPLPLFKNNLLGKIERIDLKMTNDLNYRDKTKDELIKELKKLQQEYDSQKTSYEKVITKRKQIEEALQQEKENFRHSLDDSCLLYTSDAADEEDSVDLGGRR